MLAARKAAAAQSRQLLRRQPQRPASHDSHGHGSDHHGPVNESFGKGFYITLAAIPVTLALYKLATSDTSTVPFLQRLIEQYSEKQEEWGRRNALHTVAAEQAAQDRHLFLGESTNVKSIELRYPETFNSGSPHNVIAGEGGADLTKLMEFYAKKNKDMEAARIARMKDGKVVTVYD